MDNTETHYLSYDPEEIWTEMMLNYVEAGGDILYPGDEKEMLLRSVQSDIVQVLAGVDNAMRMNRLRYAVGDYLDLKGDDKSCYRLEAAAATAIVTITTNNTGKPGSLPAGTKMTADGDLFYLLTEDMYLTGYRQVVDVEVVADRTGSVGNGLIAGTQLTLEKKNPSINSIVVKTDSTGGNEEEDDDSYRERIRLFGMASVTTGPQNQYEARAKEASSYVEDAKAKKIAPGHVGVYLLLSTNEATDAIIRTVEQELSAKDTRPLTDQVTVSLATKKTYNLVVKYTADNSVDANSAVTQAVSEYRAWQNGKIGRAFNPDRLIASIYQAGVSRVYFDAQSTFNGFSRIEYTPIGDSEYCDGTITLESYSSID